MPKVTAVTMLLTLAIACLPMEGERYEDGCAYANEVSAQLYEEGRTDALSGTSILDASWQSIDCTGGPTEDWVEGCNECALQAWAEGWESAAPDPE
jgi:hypothetical protein